jgi:hypothetical protein
MDAPVAVTTMVELLLMATAEFVPHQPMTHQPEAECA